MLAANQPLLNNLAVRASTEQMKEYLEQTDEKTIENLQNKINALKQEQSILTSIDFKLHQYDPNLESMVLSPTAAALDDDLHAEADDYVTDDLVEHDDEDTEANEEAKDDGTRKRTNGIEPSRYHQYERMDSHT